MNNQNPSQNGRPQNKNEQPDTTAQSRQPQQQDAGSRQPSGQAEQGRQAGYAQGQQKQFEAGDNESFRSQLREHMEVIDSKGDAYGKVDSIDGDRIKLTRNDSEDGEHHYIGFGQVAGIEGGRVRLHDHVETDARSADNSRA